MVMAKSDEAFKQALIGRKIPILTLDNKWHKTVYAGGILFRDQEYGEGIERTVKTPGKGHDRE